MTREDYNITAVITTKNRRNTLKKAIDSVCMQSYECKSIVVVDDASDCPFNEIVDYYPSINLKYIYIPYNESKGGNHARNIGIMNATTEYVAFLDDDDEWLPNKLQRQVDLLYRNTDIGVVGCGRILNYYDQFTKVDNFYLPNEKNDLRQIIFSMIPFTTSCILAKKQILIEAGLFDEEMHYWQEYELLIRISQMTQIGYVNEKLVRYRIDKKDPNKLSGKLEGWETAVQTIEKKHKNLLSALPCDVYSRWKLVVAIDGSRRASNCGDKKAKKAYLKQAFLINKSPKRLIKYIINRA